MNHSTLSKSLLVAFACLPFTQCSLSADGARDGVGNENVGDLGLELELSPGVNLDSVQYEITGNGISPIQGSIPVADPGATISASIGGIPAGTGYTIRISAVSTDEITTCIGTAPFAVIAAQTTAVLVDLVCHGPGTSGGVGVVPVVDDCPEINFMSVTPLVVAVGGRIHVAVAATDPDGDALGVSWTASPATDGVFANPASASTQFTCQQGGNPELIVRVSDGLCTDEARTRVSCRLLECGDSVVSPGEACDPPGSIVNGQTCLSNCALPVCGNATPEPGEACDDGNTNPFDNCDLCQFSECADGRVNGSEQCDPPNGTTCNQACQVIACGDGRVEGTEQCDPPGSPAMGGVCSATCLVSGPICICGDGFICGGEQCETPNSPGNVAQPSGTAQGCGSSCQNLLTAACVNCEATTECVEFAPGCEHPLLAGQNATSGPAIGTPRRTLCYETAECVRRTGCDNGSTGALGCYCGTADANGCLGTAANGACKAELERSLETTSPPDIAGFRFGDPQYGGGMVMARLICQADQCSAACL